MENYEEKYKEALKVIESLYNVVRYQSSSDALLASHTIEKAFPELRESEDERIRKEIIDFVKRIDFTKEKSEKWIAWLEKQGEQKPVKSEQNCYHNDGLYYAIDILEKTLGKVEGYQSDGGIVEHQTAIETVNALYHKKPTWSEEDEKNIEMLNNAIDFSSNQNLPRRIINDGDKYMLKDWLKSIKDRVQLQSKQCRNKL